MQPNVWVVVVAIGVVKIGFPVFEDLQDINARPELFGSYTANALWADAHRSKQMLAFHLNESIDVSSRNIDFIDASSAWMIEHFDLGPGKSVCDFGCGPGLYTSRLAKSGAGVTGLDFSQNSIGYARSQAEAASQDITYIQTDYLKAKLSAQFDLITMIMCDYCALSPDQRKKLLGVFQDCLKDNGAILLDVYSMAAFAERQEASFYEKNQLDHFWFESDYFCFVNTFKYEPDAVVLDKYSLFPERGAAETVYNWLQYFSPESLRAEFLDAGFEIAQVYGDVGGGAYSENDPEFAVVARRTP